MVIKLDLADMELAQDVLALQRASYAVEAKLIADDRIPPLTESLAELQACGEIFYGYFVDERLAGAVSVKMDGDTLDIHRMMVHPDFFRRGIASQLIRFVEKEYPAAKRVIVSTGARNDPARRLYIAHGYSLLGESEVIEGLWIARFEKRRGD